MTCHLERHRDACLSAKLHYKNPECKGCEVGEARAKGKEPKIPAPVEKPAEIIPKIIPAEQPSTEQKEVLPVATDLKQRILETITRRQPCSSAPMLSGLRISADELRPIIEELEREKKITTWKKGRAVLYTLAGAPSPFTAEASTTAVEKPEAASSKKKRRAPRAKREAPPVAGGPSLFAGAILDLETKKNEALRQITAIDRALEALRGLS